MKSAKTLVSSAAMIILGGGHLASAHTTTAGASSTACSPHAATSSVGGSGFSSCNHGTSWVRLFSCKMGTQCSIDICGGDMAKGTSHVSPTTSGCSGGAVRNEVTFNNCQCWDPELGWQQNGYCPTIAAKCH